MANQDFYATLGVAHDASKDDLRKAYRKLARQYHPDVRPGDKAAEERFKAITAAYDVLGDEKKRKLYDEFGEAGLREGFDAARARAYQGASAGGTGGFDLGDMLGDLFGGGGGGSRSRARGPDIEATVDVDLVQAVRGTELSLQLPTQTLCSACRGSGHAPGSHPARCAGCRGSGHLEMGGMRARCPHCGGTGSSQPACRRCGGQGHEERTAPVNVRIPAGVGHKSRLRVAGKGGSGPAGPGDLLLEVRVRPHPHFRQEGLDLVVRLPLTVAEAMLGEQVEVPTPDGPVKLKVPAGSQPGTRLRLRGKGVARGSQRGDLFAEVQLVLPAAKSPEHEAAARALQDAYDAPVREGLHF